jgi:hypothetical protein
MAVSPGSQDQMPLDGLTERVAHRVAEAGLAFDRRVGGSRPKGGRRKGLAGASREEAGEAARRRERASLRRVFLELGDAHRRYRKQTGRTGTPALREAAYAFKRAPSVVSLASVAAFLDELGLLAW